MPFKPRFLEVVVKHPLQVLANCLAQAGGGDGDHFRLVLRDDVAHAHLEIGRAAEDRRFLGEVGCGNVDGLAKMADDVAPNVGAAPL